LLILRQEAQDCWLEEIQYFQKICLGYLSLNTKDVLLIYLMLICLRISKSDTFVSSVWRL
jgi:hypothetical protein